MSIGSITENDLAGQSGTVEYGISVATKPTLISDFKKANENHPHLKRISQLLLRVTKAETSTDGSGYLLRFLHTLAQPQILNQLAAFGKQNETAGNLFKLIITLTECLDQYQFSKSMRTRYHGETLSRALIRVKAELRPPELLLLALAEKSGFKPNSSISEKDQVDKPANIHTLFLCFLLVRHVETLEKGDESYLEQLNLLCKRLRLAGEEKGELNETTRRHILSISIAGSIEFDEFKVTLQNFANQLKQDNSKSKQSLFQLAKLLIKATEEPIRQGQHTSFSLPRLRFLDEDSIQEETSDSAEFDKDIDDDSQLGIGTRKSKQKKPNELVIFPINLLSQLKASRAVEFFRKKETISPSRINRYQLPPSDWFSLQNWIKNHEGNENETLLFKLIIFICMNLELSPLEALDCLNSEDASEWRLMPCRNQIARKRVQQPIRTKNPNLLVECADHIPLRLPFSVPDQEVIDEKLLTEEWLRRSLKEIRIPVGDGLAKLIPLQGLLYDIENNEDVVRSILQHGNYTRAQPAMCSYTANTKIVDDQSIKEINLVGSPIKFNLQELEKTLRAEHQLLKELAATENFQGFWNQLSICTVRLLGICSAARGTDELFESLKDFDFIGRIAYIEDKVKDPDAPGRLFPLPEFMIRILEQAYLPIREKLLRSEKSHQHSESDDLDDESKEIPLFFLLDNNRQEGWRTITARDLLIDPRLPTNWPRHLVSTEISLRADRESVEYVMDHSDLAFAAHGVESLRTPKEMLDLYRNAIQKFLTQELQIGLESFDNSVNIAIPLLQLKPIPNISWGRRRRQEQRIKDQQSLRAIRHKLIREHSNRFAQLKNSDSPPQELIDLVSTRAIELAGDRAEDAVNTLIADTLRVLFRITPHKKHLATLSKKSIAGSILQQGFLGHSTRVQRIEKFLHSLEHRKGRTSKKLRLLEACMLVAWESRRADKSFIKEIEELNFDTYAIGNEQYIQLKKHDPQVKSTPRVCASQRVALLLKDLDKPNRPTTSFWKEPLTKELTEALSLSLTDNFKTAQEIIDFTVATSNERNIFELPLGEVKLLNGATVTQEMSLECLVRKLLPGHKLVEVEDQGLQKFKAKKTDASTYADQFNTSTNFEVDGKKLSDVVKKTRSNKKSIFIKNLNKLDIIENSLAHHLKNWLITTIEELPHHGRTDDFRQGSLIRSFDLVYPILKYLDGVLLDLPWQQDETSEVVEDFYDSVQRSSTTKAHEISRVNNFLRFLSTNTDSILVQIPQSGKVEKSEIIFSETDFQTLLAAADLLPSKFSQQVKLLFIFCYRFGFRRNEALNLRTQDIHLREVHMTIQAQGRKGAKTKYPCSNRISQCWKSLPRSEEALILAAVDQKLALRESRIFPDHTKMKIYSESLKLLKEVLGMGSIHTLRHSFIDRYLGVIFGYANPDQAEVDRTMNQLSLGKPRSYSLFSLARLVGHMSLEDSTLSRYFHAVSQLQKPTPSTTEVFKQIKTEEIIQEQVSLSHQIQARLIAQIAIRVTHHKFDEVPSLLAQLDKEAARRIKEKIASLRSQLNEPGYLGSDLVSRIQRTPKKENDFVLYAEKHLDSIFEKEGRKLCGDPLQHITSQWTVVLRDENLKGAEELVTQLIKHEAYLGKLKFLVKKGSPPSIDLFEDKSQFVTKDDKVSRNVAGGKIHGFTLLEESQWDVRAIAPKPVLLIYMVFFLSFAQLVANIDSSQL